LSTIKPGKEPSRLWVTMSNPIALLLICSPAIFCAGYLVAERIDIHREAVLALWTKLPWFHVIVTMVFLSLFLHSVSRIARARERKGSIAAIAGLYLFLAISTLGIAPVGTVFDPPPPIPGLALDGFFYRPLRLYETLLMGTMPESSDAK